MLRPLLIPLALLLPASLALHEPAPTSSAPPRACREVIDVQFDTTVSRPGEDSIVQFLRGPGPAFPADLRSVREGSVVARFVVDTTGRVSKGSAMIVSESHRGFGQSVCRFLANAKFQNASVNGRTRSVEVSAAPFLFSVGRPR